MKRRAIKQLTAVLVLLGLMATAVGSAFVYSGFYNVSALAQHTRPVYRLLQYAMERSVKARSHAAVPDLAQQDWQVSGVLLYEKHCRQCHGSPGLAPEDFSLGMVPAPTAIAAVARKREPEAIFWVVKHGIKMTGMPAWDYRLSDREIWNLVALVKQIPEMTVTEYAALQNQARKAGSGSRRHQETAARLSKDRSELAERGKIALQQYNCVSCHSIPNVTAGRNYVGPPLGGITRRSYIAGVLEFSDENFVRWVRSPRQVDPQTAMPNLGVTEAHAREMLAYLYSLERE